jgi:uncharacterized protein
MASNFLPLQRQLVLHALDTPWFMQALVAVRELGLPSWCIGAGAVRNMVWDKLHGHRTPSSLADIDVAYFDAGDISPRYDMELQARLTRRLPQVPWEVTNQAGVHQWFEAYFGHPVPPLNSLEEAVASWPEYATSVGVWLSDEGSIEVIAPHGLDDLFGLVVRRNPTRVSIDTYRQRVAQKNYTQRWPSVRVEAA